MNCFSNTKATGNAGIASFVGQTTNNSIIKNNITLVNQTVGYKFDGRTASDKFKNFSGNYENKVNVGKSTTTRAGIDFTGKTCYTEMLLYAKEKIHPIFHAAVSLSQTGGKGKRKRKQSDNPSGCIKIIFCLK